MTPTPMHDHNDNNFSGMMWMMAICCLAPFVFLLIAGKGLALQGFRGWALVAIALGLIGYHFWQMRKPHVGNQHNVTKLTEEDKNLPEQLK